MGTQRKLSRIAEAVEGILGDPVKKKKLKKRKALKRFIDKMEARRQEIHDELARGALKKDREHMLRTHLDILDKQLKKAGKILDERDA